MPPPSRAPRRRPRPTAPAAGTRERLLDAAAAAWHERSFDGVGVAELCRRAKIHKGSFFHFFPSKEELLVAVLDRRAAALREALVAGPFRPDAPPLARLRRFFADLATGARADCGRPGGFRGCPIGNVVVELATREAAIRDAARRALEVLREAFRAALDEARRAGELPREFSPDAGADALLAFMQGCAVHAKAFGDPERIERAGAEFLAALCGGRPRR